jgi:tripartite-type tricarboxylate transporter receptor subunit TctC
MPKGTPAAIVKKVSDDVQAIMKEPAMQQALVQRGSTPDLRSAQVWADFVVAETVKWANVIKQGNINIAQ